MQRGSSHTRTYSTSSSNTQAPHTILFSPATTSHHPPRLPLPPSLLFPTAAGPPPGMDTRFFVSREEFQNVQMEVKHLQIMQSSQMDRLQQLEKRHQNDAAIRSAWSTSPFPSALAGTPQHGPIRVPSTEAFDLDEQSQTLGSLHLEPDDEPIRRAVAASRANSVRFDESANMAQSARTFSDISSFRPDNHSLMMERTLSHKSDGRHSSTGHSVHSVHSMASGRSSLALDTNFATSSHDPGSPIDVPEPPPVFFVLGPVPAIIRCWLNKDFANNTLLYAAICSGAQKSTVEYSLVRELGLEDLVYREIDNTCKIHLQAYLAEAIRATKSADPVPQIPYLAVDFTVVGIDQPSPATGEKKAIRIFIGSDALRTHSADVLFSRNLMSLYSSEREKLTVPFVRPEDDDMYNTLFTTSIAGERPGLNAAAAEFVSSDLKSHNSVSDGNDDRRQALSDDDSDDVGGPQDQGLQRLQQEHQQAETKEAQPQQDVYDKSAKAAGAPVDDSMTSPGSASPTSVHPVSATRWTASKNNGESGKRTECASGKEPGTGVENGRRDASAIWGSWRQADSVNGSDGGHRETGLSGYQPAGRPRAMKVLGKSKSGTLNSAASSRTGPAYDSPVSRSSGEQRRKNEGGTNARSGSGTGSGPLNVIRWESKRSLSSNHAAGSNTGMGRDNKSQQQGLAALEQLRNNNSSASSAPRSSNPVGGASAFAWMKTAKPASTTE